MKFTTLLGAVSLTALATSAMAQDTDLLVFDYSGFEEPQHHGEYIAKHGDSPAFAFFGDEDEAFQKIRAGFAADVAHICCESIKLILLLEQDAPGSFPDSVFDTAGSRDYRCHALSGS